MPFDRTKYPLQELEQRIRGAERIVITSHVNPDGDSVGSSLGLYHILNGMGKNVSVIVPNDYPEFLHWMPGHEVVRVFAEQARESKKLIKEADLIFCLDFNALHRSDSLLHPLTKAQGFKVMIDHHIEPDNSLDLLISETDVSSTAELIYECINAIGAGKYLSREAAECLYVGIMTDTGSFSYACHHPRTFHIAGELIALGVEAEPVHRLVYDTYSENRMRLLGFSLVERMVVLPEFCTAYIYLHEADLRKFHFKVGDTEGLVNYPLSIQGINLSALFTEKKDKIRISLRSKGSFSVNDFVRKHFEGGGHRNAAGGNSYLPMKDTLAGFQSALKQYQNELKCSSRE